MDTYKVIGLMSGTSLDGVDIAMCVFNHTDGQWDFQIEQTATIPYDAHWLETLSDTRSLTKDKIDRFHIKYGSYLGDLTAQFITQHNLKPDFIASHGHTMLHEPSKGITLQIGDGKTIASKTGITTINDFRSLDVFHGGQGAPLVPIGDLLLFKNYNYCVNLGGFSNISFDQNGERIAFDICALNILLNEYALKLGAEYDDNGNFAKSGQIIPELLNECNKLDYFITPPPKSLGKEWVEEKMHPILKNYSDTSPADVLNTLCEHMATQISHFLTKQGSTALFTGGGSYNQFLIDKIIEKSEAQITIPSDELISFKEALIFAFLGVLKSRNEVNCLSSVTGALNDSICGTINLSQ